MFFILYYFLYGLKRMKGKAKIEKSTLWKKFTIFTKNFNFSLQKKLV